MIFDRKLVEIMSKNGLKGTFNINSHRALFENDDRFIGAKEAKSLYLDSGNEIALHGHYHRSLTNVTEDIAIDEIITDRRNFEGEFGRIITGLAYANGAFSDRVVELIKACGVSYARTCVSTERFDIPENWLKLHPTCHHSNINLMTLAKEFLDGKPRKTKDSASLFYVWGHSYEFDREQNGWADFEKFAQFIGGHEDVWYATNKEIYDYVTAYDNLKFSLDGKFVYNPSAIDVYLKCYDKDYLIPSGKTVEIDLK
jgi:peptidoglycan/xylan/chitin deacetylase (PgdA/CDA1 family)